jgi:antibiotic biosynthesis monooxygenase (ABM) superfamily enzyme
MPKSQQPLKATVNPIEHFPVFEKSLVLVLVLVLVSLILNWQLAPDDLRLLEIFEFHLTSRTSKVPRLEIVNLRCEALLA